MSSSKGFTLIEMMVSIGVVLIFAGIMFPRYGMVNNRTKLLSSAHTVTQNLRRAQEMALSGAEVEGEARGGYGIYFDKNDADRYILYAQKSPPTNHKYDSGLDKEIEQIELNEKVAIDSLICNGPGEELSVEFEPPNPTTHLTSSVSCSSAIVRLTIEDTSLEMDVHINEGGLIYVED